MMYDESVPHIQASCRDCAFVYDLRYGTHCPRCQGVHVAWARQITQGQYKETFHSAREQFDKAFERKADSLLDTVRRLGYPGRLSYPYSLTPGDELDITELDRMFTLEDTRRNFKGENNA